MGDLSAQSVRYLHLPQYEAPYVAVVAQGPLHPEIFNKIAQHPRREEVAYVLFDGVDLAPSQVRDTLNHLLNGEAHISKDRVYLVLIGDRRFYDIYDGFDPDFFAARYWLQRADRGQDSVAVLQSDWATTPWGTVLDQLLPQRLFQFAIDAIKADHGRYVYPRSGRWSVGLWTERDVLLLQNSEDRIPTSVGSVGWQVQFRLHPHWQLRTQFGGGFKIPNPQKILREEILRQVDLFSILASGGGGQEIDLAVEVKGHLYGTAQVEIQYFLGPPAPLQAYLGSGLAYSHLTSFYGRVDTTFTLDPNNINLNGNNTNLNFDSGLDDNRLSAANLNVWQVPFFVGIQKKWRRTWMLDLQAKFRFDPQQFSPNQPTLHQWSVQVGLAYAFVGRRRMVYDYVRFR